MLSGVGGIAGQWLIPGIIAMVFSVSRRYLPAGSKIPISEGDTRELSRLQWHVGATLVGVGIAFDSLLYESLRWTNAIWGQHDGNGRFLYLPTNAIWATLAFFAPICLSWEITLRRWQKFGQPCLALKYEAWSNSKAGFDVTRVLRLMSIGLVLPTTVAIALALPTHTCFSDDQISIGHYAAIRPKRYLYSDITKITVTKGLRLRDGSLQNRPAITLDFVNGDRWSSADNRDPDEATDQPLLNLLKEKTGLPVLHLDAFPFGSA